MPQEIGRVLLNLAGNAFYAVHERAGQANGAYVLPVAVRIRRLGQHVEVRIEDNGTGISAAAQAEIFEPFFTTKPAGEETGLGLSYDIVTQGHGGSRSVEREEGRYTAFTMRLPAPQGASADAR